MSDSKCRFCGSAKIRVPRATEFGDQVELKPDGQYGPVEDYCCEAQRTNAKYIAKNFHPDDVPDREEIETW